MSLKQNEFEVTPNQEFLVSVLCFLIFIIQSSEGWLIASLLWLAMSIYDREQTIKKAIERMRDK